MTDEELKAKLTELEDANSALVAKNRELLGEVKTFKAKAKGADIDPTEYANLQTALEEAQATIAKLEKTSKGEIDKLSKQLTEKDSALQSYLIDGGLTDALAKAGVQPHFMDAAKAMLKAQAVIDTTDGYKAVLGGKPISEAISEWANSDQGKHFVSASNNTGGGALGGNNGTLPRGDLGGSKNERAAALAQKFNLPME